MTAAPQQCSGESGWQPIETCDMWRFDHMNPMIAYWPTRGARETFYDVDEEFDDRPKGWVSPSEGWRSPGDQCIPIASHAPTHWMTFPAAPGLCNTDQTLTAHAKALHDAGPLIMTAEEFNRICAKINARAKCREIMG